MNNKELAGRIVALVGGERNISALTHCVTRLRFVLKDEAQADQAAIEALDGVLSVQHAAGQFQVVVGTKVNAVYREIMDATHIGEGGGAPASSTDGEKKSIITRLFETCSAILIPSLPPIIGGGMLKGIIYGLWGFGLMSMDDPLFTLLDLMSNCMFYFYPFLLAVSAAERFRTNKYMALSLAGALMSSTLINGAAEGLGALQVGPLAIPYIDYNSSVIPIILNVWLMSYVYRFFEKHIPDVVSVIFTPMLTLVIMVPVALAAVAPLGYAIGEYIALGCQALIDFSPAAAGFVIGAIRPLTVFTGTHHAVRAIVAQQLATYGYTTIGAMNYMSTMAQAAAPLAIYLVLRNKNKKMADISFSSFVSGMLGVTEPGLYGVIMNYKVAFIATTIGGGVGAAIAASFGAAEYGMVMSSILTIPATMGNGFMGVVIGLPVSMIVTIAIILAFRTKVLEEDGSVNVASAAAAAVEAGGSGAALEAAAEASADEVAPERLCAIVSPVAGSLKPVASFADKAQAAHCGDAAVVVMAESGELVAPLGGTLTVADGVMKVTGATGVQVVVRSLAGEATIVPADGAPAAEHAVRQGEVVATLRAPGVVPLAVDVANPDVFLDVFPESSKPVVAAGDAVLQGIERA